MPTSITHRNSYLVESVTYEIQIGVFFNVGTALIEYLVIDGASTDDTLAALKSYGDRLGWYSELDRSQAHAVNKGTARATGNWLCFPGADDYWIASTVLAQAASRLKEFGPRYVVDVEK